MEGITQIGLSGLPLLGPDSIFGVFTVFCRIAAALALMPGFGERSVPMRIKLGASLVLTAALWPIAAQYIGLMPLTIPGMVLKVGAEIAAGFLIGLWVRMLILALQMTGAIMGQQLSLSALFAGPTAPDPETSFSTLLTLSGITLLLVSGLHIEIFIAIARTYDVLPWGILPDPELAATSIVERGTLAIRLGLQLSLPFVIASFIYNFCLGAMNRAMPQLLVSLVGAPALVGGGLFFLMLALPLMLRTWRSAVEAALVTLG